MYTLPLTNIKTQPTPLRSCYPSRAPTLTRSCYPSGAPPLTRPCFIDINTRTPFFLIALYYRGLPALKLASSTTVILPPCCLYYICCCCSHINSHNQVRGHRTGSSHSGAEEYPRENTNNPRWYTHISQLTQFVPPRQTQLTADPYARQTQVNWKKEAKNK